MTWPPFSSRSYFCCADRDTAATPIPIAEPAALKGCATEARHLPYGRAAALKKCAQENITSTPSVIVALSCPLRGEVLAHVERARHRVAVDRAVEAEAQ